VNKQLHIKHVKSVYISPSITVFAECGKGRSAYSVAMGSVCDVLKHEFCLHLNRPGSNVEPFTSTKPNTN